MLAGHRLHGMYAFTAWEGGLREESSGRAAMHADYAVEEFSLREWQQYRGASGGLEGHRGEVFSAEIENGNTPLLHSIAAMASLNMVLFVKDRKVKIQELQLEVDMIITRTKHLAIEVAYNPKYQSEGGTTTNTRPRFISEKEDLLVYYCEEASYSILAGEQMERYEMDDIKQQPTPDTRARGLRVKDVSGILSERRHKELEKAAYQVRLQDQRTWIALKQNYSMAEQLATKDFSSTVIFEPFAGSFQVTQLAAAEHGWTCSQPLDLIDGYDLLSRAGRKLIMNVLDQHDPVLTLVAFDCRMWSLLTNMNPHQDWEELRETLGRATLKLVAGICRHRHQRGRYYLLENPAGSAAWVFDGILAKLLERYGGKFVIGDQCAFGLKDMESGKPIKKSTGWLSNSEVILNYLGKKCKCAWGTHQLTLGSNVFGSRSKQAAASPRDLCRSICRGLKKQMELDYAAAMVDFEEAYPVVEGETEGLESVPKLQELWRDLWSLDGDRLVRQHRVPRQNLYVPAPSHDPPVPFERILPGRRTVMRRGYGAVVRHEDDWQSERPAERQDFQWTGTTEFRLRREEDEPQAKRPHELPAQEEVEERELVPLEAPPQQREEETQEPPPARSRRQLQRRPRIRQLQRGFWLESNSEELANLLERTRELVEEQGGEWCKNDIGKEWVAMESANAEVTLILSSTRA